MEKINQQDEKNTFKFSPCKTPDDLCFGFEDYDPCELSDDITEKDLAELLKEEKLKLQQKEAEEKLSGDQKIKESGLNKSPDSQVNKSPDAQVNKSPDAQVNKTSDDVVGKSQEPEQYKERYKKDRLEDGQKASDEEGPGKKKTCKKLIKNPFFSNRLNFSMDLPPPPPEPPPQFFPPVEETSSLDKICLKRKRKCRKTDESRRAESWRPRSWDSNREEEEYSDGESTANKYDEEYGESEEYGPTYHMDDTGEEETAWEEEQKLEEEKKPAEEERKPKKTQGGKDEEGAGVKKKKSCPKPGSRPPCRKKSEEISTTLQPRKIPAVQKDLPTTCPKDISRFDGQTRIPCKKVCKKKKTVTNDK